jgi:hypothetical protein
VNLLLTIAVVLGALALVAVLVSRRSRAADDSVAEFRRQLGALSPDASRPVIRPQQPLERRGFDIGGRTSSDERNVNEDEGDDNGS